MILSSANATMPNSSGNYPSDGRMINGRSSRSISSSSTTSSPTPSILQRNANVDDITVGHQYSNSVAPVVYNDYCTSNNDINSINRNRTNVAVHNEDDNGYEIGDQCDDVIRSPSRSLFQQSSTNSTNITNDGGESYDESPLMQFDRISAQNSYIPRERLRMMTTTTTTATSTTMTTGLYNNHNGGDNYNYYNNTNNNTYLRRNEYKINDSNMTTTTSLSKSLGSQSMMMPMLALERFPNGYRQQQQRNQPQHQPQQQLPISALHQPQQQQQQLHQMPSIRRMSEVSSISYSGYLLKRSNLPYQPNPDDGNTGNQTSMNTLRSTGLAAPTTTTEMEEKVEDGLHNQEFDETDIFFHTPTPSVHDFTTFGSKEGLNDSSNYSVQDDSSIGDHDISSQPIQAVSSLATSQPYHHTIFSNIGNAFSFSMQESSSQTEQHNNPDKEYQQQYQHNAQKNPLNFYGTTTLHPPAPCLDIATHFFATFLDFPELIQLDGNASTVDNNNDDQGLNQHSMMKQDNFTTPDESFYSTVAESVVSDTLNMSRESLLNSVQLPSPISSPPPRQQTMKIKIPITARSTPTASPAVSDQQQHRRQVNDEEAQQIPDPCLTYRSVSDGETASKPPQDFIDPKDYHLWRAKYCVLDGQNLFFYAHESDAHSQEALLERRLYEDSSHQPSTEPTMPLDGQKQQGQQGRRQQQKPIQNRTRSTITSVRSTPSLLSESPMPRCNLIHLKMLQHPSYANGDDHDSNNGGVRHLHSSSTSGIHIYEKVVPLECVGTVRSAELEFGVNTIELTAVSNNDGDGNAGESDRLVIRARNKSEMNEWMFQFHRSIATFVRDIMDQLSTRAGDIHHRAFEHNTLTVPQLPPKSVSLKVTSNKIDNSRSDLGTGVDSMLTFSNIMDAASSKVTPNSAASPSKMNPSCYPGITMSPRYHKVICRTSTEFPSSSSSASTLTHGHGRNSMHRRRITPSNTLSTTETHQSSSPSSTAVVLDIQESEPALTQEIGIVTTNIRASLAPFAVDHTASNVKSNIDLDCAVRPRPDVASSPDVPTGATPFLVPEHCTFKEKSPGMIRSVSEPVVSEVKYIPPFMRKMQMRAVAAAAAGSVISESDALPKAGTYIPRSVRRGTNTEPVNLVTKIGGCADPQNREGSIMDKQYIPRKASRLAKVRTVAHGLFSQGTDTHQQQTPSRLRWEIGAVSECGRKDENEDSYIVTSNLLKVFAEDKARENKSEGDSTTENNGIWKKLGKLHPPGLFAIFDGHCGDHASRFAAERISSFIHETSCRMDFIDEENGNSGVNDMQRILDAAIRELDTYFCNLCVADSREWDSGSTLLVAALVNEHLVVANLGDSRGIMCRSVAPADVDRHIEEGWVQLPPEEAYDNSRKYLWKVVTEVHSPGKDIEQERISQANGWVTTEKEIPVSQLQRMMLEDEDVIDILKRCFAQHYTNCSDRLTTTTKAAAPQRIIQITRVCGELGVSRALGDRDFKAAFQSQVVKDGDSASDNGVVSNFASWKSGIDFIFPEDHSGEFYSDLISNVPEFHTVQVGQENVLEEFLLLACDGLWDVMDEDDAFRVARGLMFDKKWSAKKTAARLAELAMRLGSSDNITVIVVRFFLDDSTIST